MDDEDHIKKVVRSTIVEFFEMTGVDLATPQGRRQFNDNMDWIQSFRSGTNTARVAAVSVGFSSLVGGLLWLLWNGFKMAFAGKGA